MMDVADFMRQNGKTMWLAGNVTQDVLRSPLAATPLEQRLSAAEVGGKVEKDDDNLQE